MSTRPTYGQLSVSAAKAAGDAPVRVYQGVLESGETNGKPGASSGIDVSSSYLPIFTAALNRNPRKVSKYLRITTWVDADTFTITLDGSPVVVLPGASGSLDETLSAIATAIDAVSGFTASVVSAPTGTDNAGDAIPDEVLIQADAAFTLAFSASSSTVADYAEATSVTYRLWARTTLNTGDAFGAWFPLGAAETITDNAGDRINARGSDRLYMQVTSTDGRVYLLAGVPGARFPT